MTADWNRVHGKFRSKNLFTNFFLPAFFTLFLLSTAACSDGKGKGGTAKGKISLLTDPEGASFHIVGIDRDFGLTPKDGELPPGSYIFRFSKLNYKTEWRKVEITAGSHETLEVKLEPQTASVMLTTVPAGAEVIFQDRNIGITPCTIRNLPIGQYSASLKLPAYAAKEITWEVKNERPILIRTDLALNVGSLKVDSTPGNAQIFVNDVPKGNTPFNERLEQGQHKIRIQKDGYADFEQIVTVNRDKTTEVSALLEVLPSSLSILSEPSGAAVFVNGKQYNNTPTVLKSLSPGQYKVRIEKPGFDPAERDVTVTPGQEFEVSLNLDSNTGGIDLIANPPGITVYLDGKVVGVTERDPSHPGKSKLFQLRNLSAGKHTVMVAHKRALPPKRSLTLEIQKGQVERLPVLNMWIANTVLKLKNGKQYEGRLFNTADSGEEILFEPEPGIRQTYQRSEIISLTPLKETE